MYVCFPSGLQGCLKWRLLTLCLSFTSWTFYPSLCLPFHFLKNLI
jgi:hypothetical protein